MNFAHSTSPLDNLSGTYSTGFSLVSLESAVLSLLSGENVTESNEFLMHFTDKCPEVWPYSLEMLKLTNSHVRFFFVTVLYKKVF